MKNLSKQELQSQLAMTQEELIKTNEELAIVKAEYEEFAYIISHDLSASIRQIDGFSELILAKHGDDFDNKTKRHFDFIQSGVSQIKDMLGGLIHYSRLNTQKEELKLINLNFILSDIKESIQDEIDQHQADISCDNMPIIVGYESQIIQVFYHLITNALKYQLPNNKPIIKISATQHKDTWQFCVADNGIGVTDKLLKKIFKPFRRAVSNKEYIGIGMGLAMTQKIIQMHGGCIWVDSQKGKGSSFYFSIRNNLSDG